MYFNRKGAKQTNWRMVKKGKHFLFGCSLVLALGANSMVSADEVTVGEEPETDSSAVTTSDHTETDRADEEELKTYQASATNPDSIVASSAVAEEVA